VKVIITGSKTIWDIETVIPVLEKILKDYSITMDELVHVNTRGVAAVAELMAIKNYKFSRDRIKTFLPNWDRDGKDARGVRNRELTEYGDILVALWDGEDRETSEIVKSMLAAKKPMLVTNDAGKVLTKYKL